MHACTYQSCVKKNLSFSSAICNTYNTWFHFSSLLMALKLMHDEESRLGMPIRWCLFSGIYDIFVVLFSRNFLLWLLLLLTTTTNFLGFTRLFSGIYDIFVVLFSRNFLLWLLLLLTTTTNFLCFTRFFFLFIEFTSRRYACRRQFKKGLTKTFPFVVSAAIVYFPLKKTFLLLMILKSIFASNELPLCRRCLMEDLNVTELSKLQNMNEFIFLLKCQTNWHISCFCVVW